MNASNIYLADAGLLPTPLGDTPAAIPAPAVAGSAAAQGAEVGLSRLQGQVLAGAPAGRQLVSRTAKRAFDVAFAALMLFLLAPLMTVIALCVVLDSRGSVLYRARRVGRWGRQLDVLKFRKMRAGASGGPLTVGDDERFTRIGRWLARTKLDELPQLFNVVRGEMSLIGPRPEDARFVHRYAEAFDAILAERPGITGLSQIAYRDESRILDPDDPVADYETRVLPEKLQLDRLYVASWNPLLDLRILLWTIATIVLRVPVAVNRSTGQMSLRLSRQEAPVRPGPSTCVDRED